MSARRPDAPRRGSARPAQPAAGAATGWETVIGLEVHVRLATRTKLFCGCAARFGAPPNTDVCPVCLGLPGALPVPNERAVRLAVRTAFALDCTVHARSAFARKHYFYPDLPKGYQITQHAEPLATGGRLGIESPARGPVAVRIARLHVEEDAGKSLHDRVPGMTAVDCNRCGVPLVEIVTAPDLRSPGEARACLVALRQLLRYLDVSDCSMEEGSLRVDANLSVRPAGSRELRTRCEVKNLNSFANVERALAAERDRQVAVYQDGGAVGQRTMAFDAARGEVRPMRSKEESPDYRYLTEPDLPPLVLPDAWLAAERAALPELPAAKRARFERAYGLSPHDAGVLTATGALADHFEAVAAAGVAPKDAANWVMNDVLALGPDADALRVDAAATVAAIGLVQAGRVSRQNGRKVLAALAGSAVPPAIAGPAPAAGGAVADGALDAARRAAERAAEALGVLLLSDGGRIAAWVREVVAAHPGEVSRYRGGEEKVLGFLVGQVLKCSGGRADPKAVSAALREALGR